MSFKDRFKSKFEWGAFCVWPKQETSPCSSRASEKGFLHDQQRERSQNDYEQHSEEDKKELRRPKTEGLDREECKFRDPRGTMLPPVKRPERAKEERDFFVLFV